MGTAEKSNPILKGLSAGVCGIRRLSYDLRAIEGKNARGTIGGNASETIGKKMLVGSGEKMSVKTAKNCE